MITPIKPMPIQQDILYGGFIYALANLLNKKRILTEVSTFRNINVTDYHRNKIYHKYTNQKSQQLTFIQRILQIPLFPFSIKSEREKNLFEFDQYRNSDEGLYKVYFIDANLTKLRKHEFIVLKPMDVSNEVIVIDAMQDSILRMDKDSLFNNYYIQGFSILEHKRFDPVYFTEEEIQHLI